MFPHKIMPLDEGLNKKLLADFEGERTGFCQVGDKKWILPAAYAKHAEGYYTMPLRQDDVWIATFPRSGTTLCQEIIWLINNDFNYEMSMEYPLDDRFPFYEFGILHHEEFHRDLIKINDNRTEVVEQLANWRKPGYEWGPSMSSPRHIKTHLPFSLLPPGIDEKCKVIYVARNPKDVAVSYYHHNKLLKVHGFKGDFSTYWDYFKNNLLVFSPYWEHVKEGWQRRNKKNVLFIFYEELLQNMEKEIKKIANFLNKQISNEQLEKLINHVQIDNFRKVVQVHKNIEIKGSISTCEEGFIRKGKVGDHNEFSPDLSKDAIKWIDHCIKGMENMKFPLDH